MSAPRLNTCTDCGRARPDASGQPVRCVDCLQAGDPPVFGVAVAGAAYMRLHRAGALSPRVRANFLDSLTVDADAMSHRTTWHPRGLDRMSPDDAGSLQHLLYVLSGGALKPHPRRMAIVAAADLLNRYFAAPRLTPKKREPDTYCFRCGEPVPGGLFIGNGRKGARGFSWVNVDRPEAPHCALPSTPREAIARWLEPAPAAPAPMHDLAQLDLFAAPPDETPAFLPALAADAPARQLDMFGAAGLDCPHCGARKTYSDGIDDARAERRAYTCDNCGRTWSANGAQLDLLADPESAPASRAED